MSHGTHRTLAELAQQAGLSKGELEQAIRMGAIPRSALTMTPGGHRKVRDFDTALEAARSYKTVPEASEQRADGYDLSKARAHREHFAALREELRYRREANDVIDRAETERAVVGQLSALKNTLLDIPSRVAAELAALDDAHEVHVLLEAALREALSDVRISLEGSATVAMGERLHAAGG